MSGTGAANASTPPQLAKLGLIPRAVSHPRAMQSMNSLCSAVHEFSVQCEDCDPDGIGFIKFWTYFVLLNTYIPSSLVVTLEISKGVHAYFIAQVRACNRGAWGVTAAFTRGARGCYRTDNASKD